MRDGVEVVGRVGRACGWDMRRLVERSVKLGCEDEGCRGVREHPGYASLLELDRRGT